MDFPNFAHRSQEGFLTEQEESHWQPGLQPGDQHMDHSPSNSQNTHSQHAIESIPTSQMSYDNSNNNDEGSGSEGEEHGRLDPAWGIKRTDSAHILDTVVRSSSFPRPPVDYSTFSPPPQTSDSAQSYPIDEDSHSELPLQPYIPMNSDRPQQTEDNAPHTQATASEESSITNRLTSPSPEESRYDEGIPLMQESQSVESSTTRNPLATFAAFDSIDTDSNDADGFFSRTESKPSLPVTESLVLERKATDEVLNNLGLRSDAPDSPPPFNKNGSGASQRHSKEKDLAAAFSTSNDTEDDPWKAVLGDDDEFLVEDADDLLPDSDSEPEEPSISSAPLAPPASMPAGSRQHVSSLPRSTSNMYAPHQPSSSELVQFGATTHNNVGFTRQPSNIMKGFQPQPQANITNRAASYVDQSKGGYKSPYDLPMDLAPKRKAQVPRAAPQLNNIPPPPRSSSINADKQLQSPFTPAEPGFNHTGSIAPAETRTPSLIDRSASVPVRSQQPNKQPSSGFFEELPMAARPRPILPAPRIPVSQPPVGPPRTAPNQVSNMMVSPPPVANQVLPEKQDPYAQFQLRQPEKLDPYANVPVQDAQSSRPPAAISRYSPAPPSAQSGIKSSPSPRYSPAPPPQANGGHGRYVSQPLPPPPPTSTLPFQPRTSSPLAQHGKSADQSVDHAAGQRPGPYHSTSSSLPYTASFSHSAANALSPPRSIDTAKQPDFVPPRRSQTQSPSRQIVKPTMTPRIVPPPNRPVTAFGQSSPTRTTPAQNVLSPPRLLPQQRPVEEIDYVRPTNGTEDDPLERWKGAPVFSFGFGGITVSSFPRRTPRFNSSTNRPQIKVSPGEISIRKLDEFTTLDARVRKFPGPLKGKAKKKDILAWLGVSISDFENENMSFPSKRLEEKILLWKIVRVLVSQDGNLEGPQSIQNVSEILMPSVYIEDSSSSQYQPEDAVPGIYRPASVSAKSEVVDPVAVENLRKTLLKGKREDAVWQAVDSRLWAHALLLSSTLEKSVWKQVVQEFVKQEVKTIGANAESLCALYEILGGNLEESVDQLVPPSARAGLQMVRKAEASGPTRNALEGLNKWRETLCLILNNRSHEDQRALVTLARLLSDYGRIEAAHICYLFARSINLPNMFGGVDDPNSLIVLLGADHRQQPLNFHHDIDAILLSEVLEFAISTLATGSANTPLPHLAVYKLQRAKLLTDAGMKTEAQAYCDAIAAGLKSSTKHSLYYNQMLLGEIDDLSNRLKQTPVQGSSWITKPSIEKASNSVWNKFNSFVTGEDSDAESKGSTRDAAEAGPFANVSVSPTLSRTASQTDMYNAYPTMTPVAAPTTAAASRYAPNGVSSTRSSSDLTRGRMSFESQRSPPSTSHSNEGRSLYAPVLQPQQNPYSPQGVSPQPTGYQPSPEPYMPPVAEESNASQYSPYVPQVAQPVLNGASPGLPYGNHHEVVSSSQGEDESTLEPAQADYGGYQPPEDTGYVPYQPEPDSDDDSNTKAKPKKKSFINDDDDDEFSRSSTNNVTLKPEASPNAANDKKDGDTVAAARRKANDEAADAAFRAAAEADAKAAAEAKAAKKAGGSWLGGWFSGGKKSDSLDASSSSSKSAPQKVHRVHLGESKMKLYYDENKKKWVNPDNPEASEKKTLAPPPRSSTTSVPPPMGSGGGPPRSVSTPHSLPAGGISRSGTPASVAVDSEGPDSRPGSSHMGPPSMFAATLPRGTKESLGLGATPLPTPPGSSSGPPGTGLNASGAGSGPPSRPTSALSNASGLDDLLGAPAGARRASGRTAKGKKGRYVDVMAK